MNTVPLSSINSDPDRQFLTTGYNTRFTYLERPDGQLFLYEQMFATSPIFKDSDDPDYTIPKPRNTNLESAQSAEDNQKRAKRRAKQKFTYYALATYELDCFVTLTIQDQNLRYNHPQALKKLIAWLNNQVYRKGLIYLLVPELHKDGALHFHALCNSSALTLVDSGTVIIPGHKKPVKQATASRYHVPPDLWHTVYNVSDWKIGFTTAMFLHDSPGKAINYVAKYINKTQCKLGGRYFYHGGAVRLPIFKYTNLSPDAFDNINFCFGTFENDGTFSFRTPTGDFFCQRFNLTF